MDQRRDMNWPLLFAIYGATVAFFAIRAWYQLGMAPLFFDNDDATRMVVVRDFLAGQNWYDHINHRANTPFGAPMHWSRLIDVPIAALVLLFSPFAGAAAENWAGFVWPLLLLFAFLFLTARITLSLVGRAGLFPALVLPAFALPVMSEFAPGRVDHHSVQIILSLAMLYGAMEALARPRMGLWAGLAVATSIAIGVESLPMVVATIATFGLLYVTGPVHSRAVRLFAVAFALGTVGHFLIALPPAEYGQAACDAISLVYIYLALASGLGLFVLILLPLAHWAARAGAGAALGALVAAGLLVLFPQCRGGPYAQVDPWLASNWLANIGEARPLFGQVVDELTRAAPVHVVPTLVAIVIATIATILAMLRAQGPLRWRWAILLAFLLLATLVAAVQVRGLRLAGCLVFPAAAWAVLTVRRHYLQTRSFTAIAGLVGIWLGLAGIAIGVAMNLVAMLAGNDPATGDVQNVMAQRADCLMPRAYGELASLPQGRVMPLIDLGAHVLFNTQHTVVGTPYHRDRQGLLDTLTFFNGPIKAGRDILDKRGIDFVVTCNGMGEAGGLPDAAPDSFVRLRPEGRLPDWLTLLSAPSAPLAIYGVLPR